MTTTEPTTHLRRINPVRWAEPLGFDQGQLRTGFDRLVSVAGQGPVDDDGMLVHEGDVAAQLALTLANLERVLDEAGMTLRDVVHLRIHTTDIAAVFEAQGSAVTARLAELGATPPSTLVEVSRLAIPGMAVEIDALAVA